MIILSDKLYLKQLDPYFVASGLTSGDEILVINGKVVSELDMVYVETLLQDSHSVTLTVRSLKTPPAGATIETPVTCPPPPTQARLSENSIGNLKIPPPSGSVFHKFIVYKLLD